MNVITIEERTSALIESLTKIWKFSVRTTHFFLTEDEIEKIKGYVPLAIKGVPQLMIAEEEKILGFMGIAESKVKMLFIDAARRGNGVGKTLLFYGIDTFSVNWSTVNEQNPQAIGFYEHYGFKTYKRTDTDEEGGPYPLLYMKL